MNAAQAASLLGKKVYYAVGEGMKVEVYIVDIKYRWGHTRYCIRPVSGFGTTWVESLGIPDDPAVDDVRVHTDGTLHIREERKP